MSTHPLLRMRLEGAIKERCLKTLPDHTWNRYCQRPPAIVFKTLMMMMILTSMMLRMIAMEPIDNAKTVFVIFSSIPKTS